MATFPVVANRQGTEFCLVDNGPAITAVPTPSGGVPIPSNPGATRQGQVISYIGVGIPAYIANATSVSVSSDLTVKFRNPCPGSE